MSIHTLKHFVVVVFPLFIARPLFDLCLGSSLFRNSYSHRRLIFCPCYRHRGLAEKKKKKRGKRDEASGKESSERPVTSGCKQYQLVSIYLCARNGGRLLNHCNLSIAKVRLSPVLLRETRVRCFLLEKLTDRLGGCLQGCEKNLLSFFPSSFIFSSPRFFFILSSSSTCILFILLCALYQVKTRLETEAGHLHRERVRASLRNSTEYTRARWWTWWWWWYNSSQTDKTELEKRAE